MSSPGQPRPPVDVFVTIGTDHHRFVRLIDWLDEWLQTRPELQARTLVQHGQTPPTQRARNQAFFDFDELQQTMAGSTAVVVHGGPGSIFEARAQGRKPICVPRDPSLHEIVDDHQQRFARVLAEEGLVTLCESLDSFTEALDRLLADPGSGRLTVADNRVHDTIINLTDVLDKAAAGPRPPLHRQPGWQWLAQSLRRH